MRGSGARLTLNSAGNCQPYTPNNHCSSESLCQCNPLWPFSSLSVIFRRLLCVKNPECVTAELLQGKRYVHLTSLAVLTTFRLFIYYFGVFFSPCVSLCPPALSQFTTMFTLGQRFKGRPRHWRTSHWVGNKVDVGAYKHTSVPSDCQV